MTRVLLVLCLTLLPGGAPAASAQSIDDYYLDFAVPDLPGLGVLGLSPNRVTRPGPVKELAVSLLSVAEDVSTITPGVAVAWAPKQTFPGQSLAEYRRGVLRKVVLSAASVRSRQRTVLGVGGRFVFFDRTRAVDDAEFIQAVEAAIDRVAMDDVEATVRRNRLRTDVEAFVVAAARLVKPDASPGDSDVERLRDVWTLPSQVSAAAGITTDLKRAQFLRALSAVSRARNRPLPALPPALARELDRWSTEFLTAAFEMADDRPGVIRTIRNRVEREKWNAAAWYLDAALSWASVDSTWARLRARSAGAMTAVGFPAGRAAQAIVQAQYRQALDDSDVERSASSLGMRLLIGNSRNRLSVEALAERRDARSAAAAWVRRVTVGTELRVADGLWLEAAAGADASGPEGSTLVTLAGVKYTFRTRQRFVIPSQ
jgi:hypothetical protein